MISDPIPVLMTSNLVVVYLSLVCNSFFIENSTYNDACCHNQRNLDWPVVVLGSVTNSHCTSAIAPIQPSMCSSTLNRQMYCLGYVALPQFQCAYCVIMIVELQKFSDVVLPWDDLSSSAHDA